MHNYAYNIVKRYIIIQQGPKNPPALFVTPVPCLMHMNSYTQTVYKYCDNIYMETNMVDNTPIHYT